MCLYSCLSYPAWKAPALYYIEICDLPSLQFFSTLSHKHYDFLTMFIEYKMCGLIVSTTFFCNISHSKKNLVRDDHKYTYVFK
jgi:hypothetical protein